MIYLQDAVVTLFALGAVAIVVRRLAGFVKSDAKPGCANCPSAKGPATPLSAEHPLVFLRSRR